MGHFNAAHQLAIPTWSMEKNLETFGKCANPNFHGHNYEKFFKALETMYTPKDEFETTEIYNNRKSSKQQPSSFIKV